MQVAILWYPGAAFGSRTPPFFGWKTSNVSTTNQQWNLWLYTKHLIDMLPLFWLRWSSTFGKYLIFHCWQGFSVNNIYFLEYYTVYFLKACKAKYSLTCVPIFLFSDIYSNLLFGFKVDPSSDLSCLMSSMFVITLIIHIINKTCFNNTILIAELEGKLP